MGPACLDQQLPRTSLSLAGTFHAPAAQQGSCSGALQLLRLWSTGGYQLPDRIQNVILCAVLSATLLLGLGKSCDGALSMKLEHCPRPFNLSLLGPRIIMLDAGACWAELVSSMIWHSSQWQPAGSSTRIRSDHATAPPCKLTSPQTHVSLGMLAMLTELAWPTPVWLVTPAARLLAASCTASATSLCSHWPAAGVSR